MRNMSASHENLIVGSQFSRIFLFVVSILGPVVKVRIVGEVANLDIQLLYIGYYFAIQFFTPLSDLGASWSSIRNHLEKKDNFVFFFSPVGVLFGVLVSAISPNFGLIILISVAMAFLNYHLQVFRILGQINKFYICKITRLTFDLLLLLIVASFSTILENNFITYVLSAELFSICLVLLFLKLKKTDQITYIFKKIFFSGSYDYSFVVLKVIRANYVRLLSPLMFENLQFSKFFYCLLLYELVVQYANNEYLKKIINKGINFKYVFTLAILSVPLQISALWAFALFMTWEFSILEYVCLAWMGSITIYSVFSYRLVYLGAYDTFRKVILLDTLLKGLIFACLHIFNATYNQIILGFLFSYFIWFGLFAVVHYRAEEKSRLNVN